MWQRLQTLFLTLGMIGLLLYLLVPTGSLDTTSIFTRDEVVRSALAIAGIILCGYSILTYRLRMRQILVNWVSIASILLLYIIWLLDPIRQEAGYQVEWGMYMPGISMVCIVLANRWIKKDQQLIDSMDRLR